MTIARTYRAVRRYAPTAAGSRIGHGGRAKYRIDHGPILAMVFPDQPKVHRKEKRARVLWYARRAWNLTDGTEDERTGTGIYDPGQQPAGHGMTHRGENGDVTLDVSRQILEAAA